MAGDVHAVESRRNGGLGRFDQRGEMGFHRSVIKFANASRCDLGDLNPVFAWRKRRGGFCEPEERKTSLSEFLVVAAG
ncbi:MAG: hypothetical protein ACKOLA_05120, partial [Spartobacteria bacterium]